MSSENYVNYYIEILTNTMTDAIVRNISLQAQAKINNDVIQAQSSQLEEAVSVTNSSKQELESFKSNSEASNQSLIDSLRVDIKRLNEEVNSLSFMKSEYENVKHQVSHVDTFRSELLKEREEHQKTRDDYDKQIVALNKKIEKLKPTPVKKTKTVEEPVEPTKDNTIIKDGGSF